MNILVLAPHPDDETLGAGGAIAKHVAAGDRVSVAVLTGHGDSPHPLWPKERWEEVRAECKLACDVLGVHQLLFRELPTACLDNTPAWQTNGQVHEVIEEVAPDQLYIPFASDLHRDHAAIAYAASVAARPYLPLGKALKRVVAYETLSETHLAPAYLEAAFQPTLFVDISEFLPVKLKAMECYASQLQSDMHPRSLRSLRALASLRGAHIGVESAEAFVVLRELG